MEKDRIELRSVEYHEKVRQNYLSQAKNRKMRYQVVDANRSYDVVHGEIMKILGSMKIG